MTIDWNSILEGTSAGIAAAVILEGFAISRNRIRNLVLRFRIKWSFRRLVLGSSISGITLGISNHLRRGFRIREVSLITECMDFRLNPTGDVTTSFKGQIPKLTRKQKKILKKGEAIEMKSEMQFTPWRAKQTPEGFIEVEPFTTQTYVLPIHLVEQVNAPIEKIQFVVEYDNFTDGVDIMTVECKDAIEYMQKNVDHFQREIANGSLDKARKLFGLKPVGGGLQTTQNGGVSAERGAPGKPAAQQADAGKPDPAAS